MRRTIEYFVLVFFVFTISLFFFLRIDASDNVDKTIDSSRILALSDTSAPKTEDGDISFNFVLGDSEKNSESSFKYIIERIKLSYVEDVDEKKLYDGALKGMLSSLDPHSSYLTDKEFKEMQIQTKGEFGGLGIVVTKDSNFIKVVSPIDGTPAFKAGIKTGDYISEINGKNTFDMSLTDAVELMRGKVGEKVKIVVLRKKETKPLEFSLRRENIKIDSVSGKLRKDGILYIRISNFIENTQKDILSLINKYKKEKIEGVVLDLRNNPGGLLDQSIKVSEIFLDGDKVVVSIKGKKNQFLEEYKTTNKKAVLSNIPIVVLVNEGSASASEIVAGALQDYKVAIVIGEKTFGKASVQQLFPLVDGGAIKLTIARYYTPSGRSIQLDGIEPDIFVKNAKVIYDSDNDHEVREKDLTGHLENDIVTKTIKELKDNEKEEKEEEDSDDFQLLRAVDFIKGINFYNKK